MHIPKLVTRHFSRGCSIFPSMRNTPSNGCRGENMTGWNMHPQIPFAGPTRCCNSSPAARLLQAIHFIENDENQDILVMPV
jgi:hypothetical protein